MPSGLGGGGGGGPTNQMANFPNTSGGGQIPSSYLCDNGGQVPDNMLNNNGGQDMGSSMQQVETVEFESLTYKFIL